jgi:hypothetical protein
MEIKEYISNKKTQNKNADISTEIINNIDKMISTLNTYLYKLNNGEAHNLEAYGIDSINREFTESLILKEKESIIDSIKSLENTKNIIIHSRESEKQFNHDFNGKYDEI